MRVCPCCGKETLTFFPSRKRPNVAICPDCNLKELNIDAKADKWWVDSQKPSSSLSKYFSAMRDYDINLNCNPNKNEVEVYRQKYLKLKQSRTPKFVVATEHSDGYSALFESEDSNLAIAYVYGWLGHAYTQTSSTSWISMYGSVIGINKF